MSDPDTLEGEGWSKGEHIPFLIQAVEGKGLGVVANCDFQPGQLILSETVLILSRQEGSDCLTANQARQIFKQVARLNMTQREQMMELHCMGEKKILNVFRMNCIHVDETYFGLYLTISRVNHACSPNSMDCKGPVKELRAMRHIRKGEEITLSYLVNSWDSQISRRRELSYWQFKCECEVCSLAGSGLQNHENICKEIAKLDEVVSRFVAEIKAVQNQSAYLPEDDRRLLQCQIYVNLRQMARAAEDKLDLLYKLKYQMLKHFFTAHLHCLLIYCKGRALGVISVEQADKRVVHHGLWLDKLSGWCRDWRPQLCEAVGRGMLFSVEQRGEHIHYS